MFYLAISQNYGTWCKGPYDTLDQAQTIGNKILEQDLTNMVSSVVVCEGLLAGTKTSSEPSWNPVVIGDSSS